MKNKIIFAAVIIVMIFALSFNVFAYSQEKADFRLKFEGYKIPFTTFSIFVLPGESIKLSIVDENRKGKFSYIGSDGDFLYRDGDTLGWKAPAESGYYSIKIKDRNSDDKNSEMNINIFVLHPFKENMNGYIDDFKIGNYPQIPKNKNGSYKTPDGFLKIEESMLDINLSPNLKLSQFVTNQSESLPQYIVVKEPLLLKLEYLLEEFSKAGYSTDTFGIVSIYRTPYFNKEIGNNTDNTRHIYGDAADIYIDNSGDGQMDDLNNDGIVDINDARVLADLAVKFDKNPKYSKLAGGVASYKSNCVRGPFIHVDTRGFHVEW